MGRFVHCYVQYLLFYFLINHCNDFAPCGPSIGQYKILILILIVLAILYNIPLIDMSFHSDT